MRTILGSKEASGKQSLFVVLASLAPIWRSGFVDFCGQPEGRKDKGKQVQFYVYTFHTGRSSLTFVVSFSLIVGFSVGLFWLFLKN